MQSFSASSYAQEYDTANDIPDDIIAHNTWAMNNILMFPQKFPKADFQSIQNDADFLNAECLLRGLKPHSVIKPDETFCNC